MRRFSGNGGLISPLSFFRFKVHYLLGVLGLSLMVQAKPTLQSHESWIAWFTPLWLSEEGPTRVPTFLEYKTRDFDAWGSGRWNTRMLRVFHEVWRHDTQRLLLGAAWIQSAQGFEENRPFLFWLQEGVRWGDHSLTPIFNFRLGPEFRQWSFAPHIWAIRVRGRAQLVWPQAQQWSLGFNDEVFWMSDSVEKRYSEGFNENRFGVFVQKQWAGVRLGLQRTWSYLETPSSYRSQHGWQFQVQWGF